MKTIKTYLPVFPGFYNTIFEPDETSEINSIISERKANDLNEIPENEIFDLCDFDYQKFYKTIGKNCCKFIESELNEFLTSISFEKINSPKEYNFYNDAIYCEITLSEENIQEIKKFLFDNISDFKLYIKNNYSNRDGFISYYSNDANKWLSEIDICLEDSHKLGSILDFICQCKEITQDEMYDSINDKIICTDNYTELTELFYCHDCKEFFEFYDFKETLNLCENCFEEKQNSHEIICCAKCEQEITNKHEKRSLTHQLNFKLITPEKIFCDSCGVSVDYLNKFSLATY